MTAPRYLLTGRPGVGKTTLLRRIADGLSDLPIGGFFTQEIRQRGPRVGFSVETCDGQKGILAHVDRRTGPRVGRYRVDCETFERIGAHALERATTEAAVILVDEIGRMELFSNRFRTALDRAFESPNPLVATIMVHANPLTDRLKRRPDVRLVEVTPENRDALAGEIGQAMLECLQLWPFPPLDALRQTFLGAALLGQSFDPWDFLYYAIGSVLAVPVLIALRARDTGNRSCWSDPYQARR